MALLRFVEAGFVDGRRLERLVTLGDHRRIKARVRRTLVASTASRQEVLVVWGRDVVTQLPEPDKQRLREFSATARMSAASGMLGEIAAYKRFIASPAAQQARFKTARVCWDFGPIPVLRIGSCGNFPVYSTPIPQQKGSAVQQQLFPDSTGKEVVIEVIARHHRECFDDYFRDLADILLAGFFSHDKKGAPRTARKMKTILEKSIKPKLKLLSSGIGKLPSGVARAGELQSDLRLYSAVTSLFEAAIAIMRWVVGDIEAYEPELNRARTEIRGLDEGFGDYETLAAWLSILEQKPDRDEPAPIAPRYAHANGWHQDAEIAIRFLSHVKGLVEYLHCQNPFAIFVTHHMDVYASEAFYADLKSFSASAFSSNVTIWTGYGRQRHILASILAKLWLSDLQIVYVPNSLDTRLGIPKPLKESDDWVIEEISYGTTIDKPVCFVIADHAEPIWKDFLEQIESYDWKSLPPNFQRSREPDYWIRQLPRIVDHFRNRIRVTHHPQREGFAIQDQQHLIDIVFSPSVKEKFVRAIEGFRRGISGEHWIVAQALLETPTETNIEPRLGEYSAAEIADRASVAAKRTLTAKYVLDVIREDLRKRTLRFGNHAFHLIREGSRKGHRKTFRFGLSDLAAFATEFYKIPIKGPDIENAIREILTRPVEV